ncbi:MAG: LysR family transcriptional regulator [Pseudomonadales bacterium]|nr:LysR family transcriptional regulator [Pseudomonadales bacterium]
MPVHIETNEIRALKTVHDEGGFKKAADRLFITQSAVSQTIANLEKKLDTVLFERNPLKLTETGIRLLHYAESVLAEEENVLTDIRNIKEGILSTLLLAISGTINHVYGARMMNQYCATSPLTRLKIQVMPSRQIISAITTDLWELGFGPFQKRMPDQLTTLPLFEEKRNLMISRDHPSLQQYGNDPLKLAREVPLIVSHLDDPDMRPALDKLRDSFGTIWEISDINLRCALVAAGSGMSFLDRSLINSMPGLGNLQTIDSLDFAEINLTYGIFHRKRKQLSSGARNFIEFVSQFQF